MNKNYKTPSGGKQSITAPDYLKQKLDNIGIGVTVTAYYDTNNSVYQPFAYAFLEFDFIDEEIKYHKLFNKHAIYDVVVVNTLLASEDFKFMGGIGSGRGRSWLLRTELKNVYKLIDTYFKGVELEIEK